MNLKTFIIVLTLMLLIFSCQPRELIRKDRPAAEADSVLFYQQKPVADPFLLSLNTTNDNEVVLSKRLIPPPPEIPKFKQIDGYRVQVFAGSDSLSASAIKYTVNALSPDSVYLIQDMGLIKVQAGDFLYYPEADKLNQLLRKNGFASAWITQTLINMPVPPDSPAIMPEETNKPAKDLNRKFKIQVLATSDEFKAKKISTDLSIKFNRESFYEKTGTLFKVFVGGFSSRADAEAVLTKIRGNGYPDAWIAQ
ncbi:MAG: SPOR domain-containing protein [Calditrichaceae bacterium]